MEMHGVLNMKRLLLAAILLAPLPALADNLTVSVGSVAETWTLSADDQTKFDEWVQAEYKCTATIPLPAPPAPPCTPLTLAQSQALWAKATLQGTIDNVDRHHKLKAAQDAAGAVSPISPVTKKGP